jgi:hypothetical protein
MRATTTSGMTLLRDSLQDFELKDNTLSREVKDSDADRIQLEIGDSKTPTEALPQAKVMRWDNEVNLSVRRVMDMRGVTSRTEGEHVVFDSTKEEIHIYEKPDIAEDGGLEIEIHLKEKPDTNRFDFTIQTKGLNFYYQPALTKEEIEQGATRPENIEGSYAVYHATKRDNRVGGKEYKAGKFCHIYRPHITDADGNEAWGELELDEQAGLLTVVVPQEFLDKASYPVIVDPTFGYTSAGASWAPAEYTIVAQAFEAPATGSVTELSAYIDPVTDRAALANLAMYERAGAGDPGNLLNSASSDKQTISGTSNNPSWYNFLLNSSVSITNGTSYFLACLGERRHDWTNNSVRLRFDTTTSTDTFTASGVTSFGASGTYTTLSNETSIRVRAWGSGGTGGGRTSNGGGGGGGGGAMAQSDLTVTESTGYAVVVGAQATAGGTGNGGSGNASSFNTTSVVAAGGNGGAGGTGTAGGAGGTVAASTGTTRVAGTKGGNGGGSGTAGGGGGAAGGTYSSVMTAGGNASGTTGGTGGVGGQIDDSSSYGNRGGGPNGRGGSQGAGEGGGFYGGGGSGAYRTSTNQNGGRGAAGRVIVFRYFDANFPTTIVNASPLTTTNYSIYATYTEASTNKTNVKISGTFEPVTTNIKLSGTFVEKTMKVKVGGTFV